ncbi:hypothetical protein DL95DRAFT_382678 [Leptodontidium sp. 2 PMI_412]|nr:hypothetical protein DL95DRAFT_382678 [Leptodontidium sp. 2 PMI_412]
MASEDQLRLCKLCGRVGPDKTFKSDSACISCPIRCSTCKQYRSADDFSGRKTCASCRSRLRDVYRERKGEPVENPARRLKQTWKRVEEALQSRLAHEKKKAQWLEGRELWLRGKRDIFTTSELASFPKGPIYLFGPYRQWVGYSEPREEPLRHGYGWDDPEGGWDGWKPQYCNPQETQDLQDNRDALQEDFEDNYVRGITPEEVIRDITDEIEFEPNIERKRPNPFPEPDEEAMRRARQYWTAQAAKKRAEYTEEDWNSGFVRKEEGDDEKDEDGY